ncbi:hypothetical protein DRN34_00345 [Thermococci archaeon]|nr:MAG: hypothetical protein DRN34_00345 [Thermococci archaeon]
MQDNPAGKNEWLQNRIESYFFARGTAEMQKCGSKCNIRMLPSVVDNDLWLTFTNGKETHSVTLPLPVEENSVWFVDQHEVRRALCNYFVENTGGTLDYWTTMYYIICGDPTGIVSKPYVKKTPFIQQIIYSFQNENTATIIYNLQRAINELVSKMPLHKTFMNSWMMNRRLAFIDPLFDELSSPKERLDYQTTKAKKYFDRGWTALGLSDGVLADKNYILTDDVRRYTPFGLRWHNPQRNLYSTLGMLGGEKPLIRSESMEKLIKQGVERTGWNWFTLFADIPDNFEDQIVVDVSHANKTITHHRRFQCFGELSVKPGEKLKYGAILSRNVDGGIQKFDTVADSAKVDKITLSYTNIGGIPTVVHNVIVAYKLKMRDGTKITNFHGNKGVIRLKPLGHAKDPRTGELVKIDVIVSAKSIGKRKNFGQLLEAMVNNITNDQGLVVKDDFQQPLAEIQAALVNHGFNVDATWECETYVGKLTGVCGKVFWGVINHPEYQLWKENATIKTNGKDLRTAGLKFSTIEFRALETRFGKGNPILDEIMSYMQGTENLHEELAVLASKKGILPANKPIINVADITPLDQTGGTIVNHSAIEGTVVDDHYQPDGFIMQLPVLYQTMWDKEKGEVAVEGLPMQMIDPAMLNVVDFYTIDKLYIPSVFLRRCWRHSTGKVGLNDIGVLINNVVALSHRYLQHPEEAINTTLLYSAIRTYFARIAGILGTKRGDISTNAMSVRYPFAAKAVATLSNGLDRNTIEIHRDMADTLMVSNGDIVLTERFPCLGFASVRPQKVKISDDPNTRYTIRVSGNSLVSQNLDFDGDTLFIASFHTDEAKDILRKEFTNPNKTCYDEIKRLNIRKGAPHIKCMRLNDYNIQPFTCLTNDRHAEIVEKNTGVKAQTGPVIALTYNLMRIMENSGLEMNKKLEVGIEMFMEKAAQSVFEQKHGGQSLHEIVIDATCTGNVAQLVQAGFNEHISSVICDTIRRKAKELSRPQFNLVRYHELAKENGWSNIIARIVREQNLIYYASRCKLEGIELLNLLEAPAVDIPSRMFKWSVSGKAGLVRTKLDEILEEKELAVLKDENIKEACTALCECLDTVLEGKEEPSLHEEDLKKHIRNRMFGRKLNVAKGIHHR